MLNATVGVQRAIARLRFGPGRRYSAAADLQRHSTSIARTIRASRSAGRPILSGERLVSVTAVGLVAIALAISNVTADAANGPTGGTSGSGTEPRIAIAGAVGSLEGGPQGGIDDRAAGSTTSGANFDVALSATSPTATGLAPDDRIAIDGPFRDDGTLLKPIAVDTTVADGAQFLQTYRVKSGDTLTGIAHHFHVSMMTIWWANHLSAKDQLHIGQTLTIPPVSGVVVKVTSSDTLDSLAARYGVEPVDIIDTNNLADPNLVVGQTLIVPGARAAGIAAPRPTAPRATTTTRPTISVTRHVISRPPPSSYTGGKFLWPVPGGYISQYFHYGHYAIDIAADPGTRVLAAASGTVIFAGWKDNGGGYQVWISHGSNLYTTYNHMMSVSVGRGQSVSRGQQVGRVGMTGNATGPHCHFEVWRGMVWAGGTRVNPLLYL